MADQNNAGTGAKDEGTTEEQNPFAGFQSEGFQHGERIENADTKDEKDTKGAAAGKPAADAAAASGDRDDDHEDDEKDDDRDDDRDNDDLDDEDDKPKDEGKSKRKPASRRIGELTRLRRDAERRAEAAERRVAQLEGRDADHGDEADKDGGKKAPKSSEKSGPPDPEDEKYSYGEIDPKYISDLARYEAREAAREAREEEALTRQQEQAVEHQRAVQKKFEDQIKVGQERYEDFDEVVMEGAENNEWVLSRDLAEMIVESPVGADIAYHLASHPEEAAQVYRQTPMEQARHFGKLEAKFSATQAAAADDKSEEPEQPKLPKAPAPPETPRGRGGRHRTPADTDDFAAFEKMAMKG